MTTVTKDQLLMPQSCPECCLRCCATPCYVAYVLGMRKGSKAEEAMVEEPALVKAAGTEAPPKVTTMAPKPQTMSSPTPKAAGTAIDLDSINVEECLKTGKKKTRLDAPALEVDQHHEARQDALICRLRSPARTG